MLGGLYHCFSSSRQFQFSHNLESEERLEKCGYSMIVLSWVYCHSYEPLEADDKGNPIFSSHLHTNLCSAFPILVLAVAWICRQQKMKKTN